MKKALVCPNEFVPNGFRIAQVELERNVFLVAEPLFWVDCADDVVPDQFYFDPTDSTIKAVPLPPPPKAKAENVVGDAPNVLA